MREAIRISEVMKRLKRLKTQYGDLKVIYGSDDEGNSFHKVIHSPSIVRFNEQQGDALSSSDYEELKGEGELWYPDNSEVVVCIN